MNRDSRLRGLPVAPGLGRVTVVQFADDVTLLASEPGEIDLKVEHIDRFELASGARLNRAKTSLLAVSRGGVEKLGFKIEEKSVKILGIEVGIEGDRVTKVNWDRVINKVKHIVNRWRPRGLSLRGKVIVWNALVASTLVHVLGTCELPQWALKALNGALSSYLWRRKANSIAHRVLIAKQREGGLGLIDISAKRDALRVKIVRTFLDSARQCPWEGALASCLAQYGVGDVYNLCTLPPRAAYSGLPPFYQEVLEA